LILLYVLLLIILPTSFSSISSSSSFPHHRHQQQQQQQQQQQHICSYVSPLIRTYRFMPEMKIYVCTYMYKVRQCASSVSYSLYQNQYRIKIQTAQHCVTASSQLKEHIPDRRIDHSLLQKPD